MTLYIRYISRDGRSKKVTDDKEVPDDATFIWYDYDDFEDKEQLISDFNFKNIYLEDEHTKAHRPLYNKNENYRVLICHTIDKKTYHAYPVNIIIMENKIITFHNDALDNFVNVEKLLKDNHEDLEVDVALHILLEGVDEYFKAIHLIEEEVIEFEDKHAGDKRSKEVADDIFDLRKKILHVIRVIVPMQEIVEKLKDDDEILSESVNKQLIRRLTAKVDRQLLIIKFCRDMTDEMKDNFMTYNNFRMNTIMKVLTILSAIFLPLTLIAGIYGMNFENMPELSWNSGYYLSLGLMLFISIGMLAFFKYKDWM